MEEYITLQVENCINFLPVNYTDNLVQKEY